MLRSFASSLTDIVLALDTPLRNPWSVYFSAILKGFGGGFAIMNAVHSAFVADTSSTASRSFHMGLVWIMYWMGAGVSPVVSAVLMEYNLYVENFATAAATWILYLGYVAMVLPETLPLTVDEQEAVNPVPEDEIASSAELGKTKWRRFNIFHTFWDPVRLIFGHPTLRWLGVVSFTMLFAVGAFSFLVPYCDGRFGLDPIQVRLVYKTPGYNSLVMVGRTYHCSNDNLKGDICALYFAAFRGSLSPFHKSSRRC